MNIHTYIKHCRYKYIYIYTTHIVGLLVNVCFSQDEHQGQRDPSSHADASTSELG